MSNAYDPQAPRVGIAAVAQANARVARLGLSSRQMELSARWAQYRAKKYESRTIDWDGKPCVTPLEAEQISTQGYLPPGFTDAGASLPIRFRRPTAPYHLPRVVVNRFTSLLFSAKQHPKIVCENNPAMEDYLSAIAEDSRLWARLISARKFGGAQGTAVVSFRFVAGHVRIETHDPRWCEPEWKDRDDFVLRSIEKRYQFGKDVTDPKTGLVENLPHWYRRVITESQDITWEPVPVGDGEEPDWDNVPCTTYNHSFGFCPVVWVQNLPMEDEIDGEHDFDGIEEMCEAIDMNLAAANRGILGNSDPTVVMVGKYEVNEVRKGNDNALKVPEGTVAYLEASMKGPEAAKAFATETLRNLALEVVQCVLDHPDGNARTATEIERVYSTMIAKADVLREQYGEHGVKRLIQMIVKALVKLARGVVGPGGIVRQRLLLPPRIDTQTVGDKIVRTTVERVLPPDAERAVISLRWPPYFAPGVTDAGSAADAAGKALLSKVIDQEHAVGYVAPFFGVEDVPAMLKNIRSEQGMGGSAGDLAMAGIEQDRAGGNVGGAAPADRLRQFYQYEIEGGIVSINEVRQYGKGLGPLLLPSGKPDPDGNLTLPAYRAKHPEVFAASTVTQAQSSAEKILGMPGSDDASSAAGGGFGGDGGGAPGGTGG